MQTNKQAEQALYPLAVLLDELKSEDQKKRINAVQSLGTIAIGLGPERTRNELLPYILELLDDESEVLAELCTVLGNMLDLCGGPQFSDHVLKVLERLCFIEEPVVREKATQSIKQILKLIRVQDFENFILEMIQRLGNNDSPYPKYAAVHLINDVYPNMSSAAQQEIMKVYSSISQNQAPQVRKQAAIVLNDLINLMPVVPEADVMNAFNRFYKDEQDSVRMQCIDCCVTLSKQLPPVKVASFVVPCIKKFSEDKSWRIRYLVADRIREIAKGVGIEGTKDTLLPYYVTFLKDAESEVRTAACSRMSEFCLYLDQQSIIQKILPCLKDLQTDQFIYVRAALADNILSLCPKIQKVPTQEHILPIFLLLLRDDDSKVRLNLFNHLEDLNQVIGIQDLQQSIIPSLTELSSDKNWRTKHAVAEQFPMLAKKLGESFFSEKLNQICIDWLKDPIFSIREIAIENVKELCKIFGPQWSVSHVLPVIMGQHTEINYLHRVTPLFAIGKLSSILPADILRANCIPVLSALHTDKVPNIRMNVAKAVQLMIPHVKGSDIEESCRRILTVLSSDKDLDVQYFSKRALTTQY